MNKVKVKRDKLYIIGNGFDIHHGLNSRLSDFRKYLEQSHYVVHDAINNYLIDLEGTWGNFEEVLARINTEQILEDVAQYLGSPGDDDYHRSLTSVESEIMNRFGLLSDGLETAFYDWLQTLPTPSAVTELNMDLLRACFISFNYTNTLKSVYGVESDDVLHLHGMIDERDSIVLGHGDDELQFDNIDIEYEYDQDPKTGEVIVCGTSADEIDIHEINRLAIEHYRDSKKESEEIIAENILFFENLNLISDVFVLGHSLSDVDIAYYQKIVEIVPSLAKWHVSWYSEKEKAEFPKKLAKLGVSNYVLGPLKNIVG